MQKGLLCLIDGIELVDGKDDGGNPQQLEQQTVAACLGKKRQGGRLPIDFGGVDQYHCGVSAGSSSHHIAGVLLMARGVANDEFALLGAEVAVGDIDGDALFTLSGQAVGQQGQVGFALALNACQMVLQNGFGVYQQTPNQG